MAAPPVTERGTPAIDQGFYSILGGAPYSWGTLLTDSMEHVSDLQWQPGGGGLVGVYHKMRTDAQIQGLFLGSTLPLRRYAYVLEPNSSREEIVTKWSRDYNIPIKGQEDQPRGRRKNRFQWNSHLRLALLSVLYGHMYFEQVGEIGADGLWHCRKLGPRMPQSIQEIRLDRTGGLRSIVQNVNKRAGSGSPFTVLNAQQEILVNRLIAYIWEQEGGDWTGRSMLRGIYKNWLLKDRILRVGAINIERAGGVPVIKAHKGASDADMTSYALMAQQFKVGENSGGSIPNDAELMLARAAGGEEAVNFIKLQNEEMGRGWLMMFMNLGQTTSGSRALGGSFIDYALNSQEAIAQFICDTFTEHMLENDADWNYALSDDEPLPYLTYVRKDDRQMALTDLVAAADAGVITLDDQVESWIREAYRMPRRDEATERQPSTTATSGRASERSARVGSPALGGPQARDLDDLGLDEEALKQAAAQQEAEFGA
jgi:hypothetical protein